MHYCGVWFLRELIVCPNTYYNYRKHQNVYYCTIVPKKKKYWKISLRYIIPIMKLTSIRICVYSWTRIVAITTFQWYTIYSDRYTSKIFIQFCKSGHVKKYVKSRISL